MTCMCDKFIYLIYGRNFSGKLILEDVALEPMMIGMKTSEE